jgi:tetratricopeptide (TPR) repeat protein
LPYYNDLAFDMSPAPDTVRAASGARSGQRRRALMCGFATLAGALVYLNALHNPFVYDDYHTVVENPSLLNLTDIRTIVLHTVTRPLINFSYALDRAMWGPSPFGFHLTNLVLHAFNVFLVFQLAWILAKDRGDANAATPVRPDIVASATAVLFAVHPMMTEAVGYISGRSEVLCATFFILALICGRRWIRNGGIAGAILTLGLWVAALATKEIGAMFPFVLLCYDRLVFRADASGRRRRLLTLHLPLLAAALAAGVGRLIILARVEYPGQIRIHWPYFLLDLDLVRRYAGMILLPRGQAIFHQVRSIGGLLDPHALLGMAAVGALLGVAWRLRAIDGIVSFGIAWFLLLLAPSSALIMLDQGEAMTEHRIYLASCGLFLALGATASWFASWLSRVSPRAERLALAAFAAVVIALAGQTVWRNLIWADPVTLWSESVELAPDHYRPRLLLGEALQDAGRVDEAVEQYQAAVRLQPGEPASYLKLGMGLARIGRLEEAEAAFRGLQGLDPRSVAASSGLGAVAMLSHQPERARRYFLETIGWDPNNVPARQSLALLDEMEPANPTEALRWCNEIRQIAPETPGNDECIRRNRSRLSIDSRPR